MKRLLSFIMCFLILIAVCGCKGAKEGLSSSEVEPLQNDNGSETTVSAAPADDTADPENTESVNEGAEVNIESVTHKKGVALGIDVSKWQGKIDWSAVKNSGTQFAIIRIGYRAENGKIYKDSHADYNIQQAVKQGILVGVYFFSTAVNTAEAIEEADFVISSVKGYKISYPVVYDCEGYTVSNSRMNTLSADSRTDNALAFLERIKKAGYTGMFYGAKSEISGNIYWNMPRIEQSFKIWIAHYTTPTYPEVEKPDYNGKYDMWQYTNRGNVNGIEGNCDINVSYFTADEQNPKDTTATPEQAKPPKTEQEKLYTEINDQVTAKEEVNLREGAGTNFNIVAKLKSGEFLTRTGVGSNGWSRLLYNGKTVYVITSYLSNTVVQIPKEDIVAGCKFIPKSDRVTAKVEVNLRVLPTTNSEVIGSLKSGTFLVRTAVSDKGWSRLEFNGQTVYAVTSYLTDKAPEISSDEQTDQNGTFTEHGMTFKGVDSRNVTAKEETNLRDKPTTESDIIHTLVNGEYVTLVAESDSGWAKLMYNGRAVYAIKSFLQ